MVPLLRTDAYGNFIPGANGFPQVITGVGADGVPNTADDIVIEGNPTANGGQGVSMRPAIRTTSMFLADIAHHAAPNGSPTPTARSGSTISAGRPPASTTMNCSTGTSSPATAASTRTSA